MPSFINHLGHSVSSQQLKKKARKIRKTMVENGIARPSLGSSLPDDLGYEVTVLYVLVLYVINRLDFYSDFKPKR